MTWLMNCRHATDLLNANADRPRRNRAKTKTIRASGNKRRGDSMPAHSADLDCVHVLPSASFPSPPGLARFRVLSGAPAIRRPSRPGRSSAWQSPKLLLEVSAPSHLQPGLSSVARMGGGEAGRARQQAGSSRSHWAAVDFRWAVDRPLLASAPLALCAVTLCSSPSPTSARGRPSH